MYYPIKFKPVYKDYMWGGRYFERFGREQLPGGILAESWEVSCHRNGISVVINGDLQGKTLPEIIMADPKNILGTRFSSDIEGMPLLIKFLDSESGLSVQVHPDDSYAAVYECGHGKNELWYILDAKPEAAIIAGLKPGITGEEFLKAIGGNRIEDCLQKLEVSRGDVISIPAGLVHSIGAGVAVVEIQQTSDITYRVYDYDRVDSKGCRRLLHLDRALEVIDFNVKKNVRCDGVMFRVNESCVKTVFMANRHFACEQYEIEGNCTEECNGSRFCVFVCLEGSGTVEANGSKVQLKTGDTVFLPASLGQYYFEGEFKALKTYVPDFNMDIVEPMRKSGCSDKEIYKVLSCT